MSTNQFSLYHNAIYLREKRIHTHTLYVCVCVYQTDLISGRWLRQEAGN